MFSASRSVFRIGVGMAMMLCSAALYAAPGGGQPPVPVMTQTVEQQDIPVYRLYPGRTQAVKRVSVHARVPGVLQKKFYQDGETVKAGQLLYKIDDRIYRAKVNQARAQVKVDQAKVNRAMRELERVEKLPGSRAVSQQERDRVISELELAKAALLGAQAALESAQIDLDYTEVKAEISGVTGIKKQDIGSLVGSGPDNSVLTTLTQLDPIHVVFSIPDSQRVEDQKSAKNGKLKLLDVKQWRAEVVDSAGQVLARGQVDFIDREIDPDTGSVLARARFANADQVTMPGEFVRVRIYHAVRKQVFRIPQKSVLQQGQQSFVYVVEAGQAKLKPVHGLVSYMGDWLVDGGLQNGDRVIVNNLIKLRPNSPVQVVQPKPAGADQ